MDASDVKRSRRLSLVLRHKPETIGIDLDAQGWVPVATLLRSLSDHGTKLSRTDLARIVAENDKQRFEIDPHRDRIRARQGHTREVDLGLDPATPPAVLFHGTPRRNVGSIMGSGLDRRRRQHVHLSADVATAEKVGARRGDFVIFEVDAAAMAAEGHVFWCSSNGVWLTDGVPARFLALGPHAAE